MIYLDNAATTYPKPPQTIKAMEAYLREGSRIQAAVDTMTLNARKGRAPGREQIAEFISADYPERLSYIKRHRVIESHHAGQLETGDHLIITSMEHNAVAASFSPEKYRGGTGRGRCG